MYFQYSISPIRPTYLYILLVLLGPIRPLEAFPYDATRLVQPKQNGVLAIIGQLTRSVEIRETSGK